jgi:hypothetical protein
MKMKEINSIVDLEMITKYDHLNRRCPFKISLINGEHFTGLYAGCRSNDLGIDLIWFKILDVEQWIHDTNYIGTEMVYFKPAEIDEIEPYC